MGFLSEAVTSIDQTVLSPFTESIILATICGRALSHKQQSAVEQVYNNIAPHFWDRHEWLDTILKTRAGILILNYPSSTQHSDCMLLFTNMVAQTTVLYLCKVMESMSWETDEYRSAIAEFKQRSLQAAQEIVNLTRSLSHLSYFKVISRSFVVVRRSSDVWRQVHPFTPLPLVLCADFLNTHRYLDELVDTQVQEILDALRDLTSVNNLAQEYLS